MPGRRLWWLGLCLWLLGAGSGTAEPCRGLPCAGGETPAPPCRGLLCGGRAGRPVRSFLHTASPMRPPQGKAPPAAPHAAPPPPRSPAGGAPYPGARRGLPEACSGGDCAVNGTRRDCQGLECRLPPRLRPRPRGSGCVAPADGCPEPALLRAAERAARFAGDDFAYAASELGGSALGLQLTCDVKPATACNTSVARVKFHTQEEQTGPTVPLMGNMLLLASCCSSQQKNPKRQEIAEHILQSTCLSTEELWPMQYGCRKLDMPIVSLAGENEVPSEDALILQLHLAKGHEKFTEVLKSQQQIIVDLQQKLTDQQQVLVSQQREILQQQRQMSEQMELIKVQYGVLLDTVKQVSFQSLQEDIQSYFESHLQGLQNQVRNHLQKSYSVHKVEVDAKVINVGESLLDCGLCERDEFCNFQKTPSQCEKCTLCPAGFFQMAECSANSDRICQDRDECTESPSVCGERIKCLNTPGGFRCLGVAEKDAALGMCGEEYFFSKEMQECQACLKCEDGMVAVPCSTVSDTVCSATSANKLSESWAANIALPPVKSDTSQVYSGLNLKIKAKLPCEILSVEDNRLIFRQHGLLWTDLNFAVKHNCRNFLQLSLKLNGSEEGYELSGVRLEQPEGRCFQSTSLSSAAEVEPNQTLSVHLRSPNKFCNQSKDLNIYDLHTPLSLLWLSHDTGAVALSAQVSTAMHYQTNYRPTFKIISVSDPYMLSLSHDGRAIKFTEAGVAKFVFHQALYSMGHMCVREGFSLISYINKNGTNRELMNVFKSGVNYRDTSISASGATKVGAGDLISFEILSPAQCNVRYFGDASGISMFSLIWIPAAVSSTISATVSVTSLPTGPVRNRLLDFTQASSSEQQIQLLASGQLAQKYFMFTEKGVASLAFNLKLIHSCNVLKVTLNQLTREHMQPTAIAQQIGGQMPEGSMWTSVSLRASFQVRNGTLVSVSLDCVRGRINQVAREHGTNVSILWIAS